MSDLFMSQYILLILFSISYPCDMQNKKLAVKQVNKTKKPIFVRNLPNISDKIV